MIKQGRAGPAERHDQRGTELERRSTAMAANPDYPADVMVMLARCLKGVIDGRTHGSITANDELVDRL